jgi:uroporphyrinogen-III synthase
VRPNWVLGRTDWITVTSPSIARALAACVADAGWPDRRPRIASIGATTSDALRDLGIAVDAQAAEPDAARLCDAIIDAG